MVSVKLFVFYLYKEIVHVDSSIWYLSLSCSTLELHSYTINLFIVKQIWNLARIQNTVNIF